MLQPRRGIASLDERDIFRIDIADAGEYQLSVTEALTRLRFEPDTYYAEIGTPYTSDGNTGPYTFTVTKQ